MVEAVKGSNIEVYLDGGVRKGTDVLKALAMGARAVFIGRPALWGLAYNVSKLHANFKQSFKRESVKVHTGKGLDSVLFLDIFFQGEPGVRKVLDILKDEFSLAMGRTGNYL